MKPVIPEGAKVFITHYRYTPEMPVPRAARLLRQEGKSFLPCGGETTVRLFLPDGREAVGVSVCSKRDNFSKLIGRNIAIGRALKSLNADA